MQGIHYYLHNVTLPDSIRHPRCSLPPLRGFAEGDDPPLLVVGKIQPPHGPDHQLWLGQLRSWRARRSFPLWAREAIKTRSAWRCADARGGEDRWTGKRTFAGKVSWKFGLKSQHPRPHCCGPPTPIPIFFNSLHLP